MTMIKLVLSFALVSVFVPKGAAASSPVPLPPPGSLSSLLPPAEWRYFTSALNATEAGDWRKAEEARARVQDPAAATLLDWSRYRTGESGASFQDISAFQKRFPHWPQQKRLRIRAEKSRLRQPASHKDIMRWFAQQPPLTGNGKIRLGEAFLLTGQKKKGVPWIREGWRRHRLTATQEARILKDFGEHLSPQDHEERLTRLLWERHYTAARRMFRHVSEDSKAIARARIRLTGRAAHIGKTFARLPGHLRNTPGLLYEAARLHRRRGRPERALSFLLNTPPSLPEYQERWWRERKIVARHMLAQKRYAEAYSLARAHGRTGGIVFAEGEFLAGWIALRFLEKPEKARTHFGILEQGVRTPVSKARAAYWLGRTHHARGQPVEARLAFQRASQYMTTFYGQLALGELLGDKARLQLPPRVTIPSDKDVTPGATDLARAVKLLYTANRKETGRILALHLAHTLQQPEELAALSDTLTRLDQPGPGVRVAKIAASRHFVLPERAYPVSSLHQNIHHKDQVEKALVYGISRQESEFNPRALSDAGARGIMQLMPSTARVVARHIRVRYRKAALLDDPGYNTRLGSAHLGALLEQYSGSYVMSIAAYNAGPRRVQEWVMQFGDPRSPSVDTIDWIESIPVAETRNYVQRVLENTQVYRVRLAGHPVPLGLPDDLNRSWQDPDTWRKNRPLPRPPMIRPQKTGARMPGPHLRLPDGSSPKNLPARAALHPLLRLPLKGRPERLNPVLRTPLPKAARES